MANGTFNIALGEEKSLYEIVRNNTQANSVLTFTFLQASVADDVLNNFDDLAALLADAGNTEATFTNFARVELDDTQLIAPAIDDGANTLTLDLPDITFTDAGGAANNTLVKAIVCFDPDSTAGTDADIIPIFHFDVAFTTQGLTFTVNINANGIVTISG